MSYRMPDYESKGRGFESPRARQQNPHEYGILGVLYTYKNYQRLKLRRFLRFK